MLATLKSNSVFPVGTFAPFSYLDTKPKLAFPVKGELAGKRLQVSLSSLHLLQSQRLDCRPQCIVELGRYHPHLFPLTEAIIRFKPQETTKQRVSPQDNDCYMD